MSKNLIATILIGGIVFLGGCATSPDKLSTTYVSPLKYKDYDCDQIITEMNHVSERTTALYQNLNRTANNDALQMTVGLVLFWPALFFLEGGDGPEAQEYSNLKGEFKALRTAAVKKKCESEDFSESPEEIIKEKAEQEKRKQSN